MKQYIKQNWKRICTIMVIYTCWSALAFLFLVALQGRSLTIDQFGGDRIYWNFTQTIIKGTIEYYILIFYITIPMLKYREWKQSVLKICSFFILLTIYEYIWAFHIGIPMTLDEGPTAIRTFVLSLIMLDVLVFLISLFVAVMITSNEMRKRKIELEKEKLTAELAAVKYQINPHFLFNSLSFIYTKTFKDNPDAAEAVQLLSDIMSYALEDWGEQGTVPLLSEVAQMKKVIAMNQIRYSHRLPIRYTEDIQYTEVQIPILVFVTLIENAFKHGDLTDNTSKLSIKLKTNAERISFKVINKKKKGPKEPSKGIGLSNVKKRLALTYGNKQSFIINEDENYYSNEITINL